MGFCESEIFTIEIGEENKYFVHKDAISCASAVLKKEVESKMKEGETKVIKLKDSADDWLAFGLFLQFSYFGGYGYDENEKENALTVHASVYVFSEKVEALELKKMALKKATNLCANAGAPDLDEPAMGMVKVLQFALPEAVRIIYQHTYDKNTGKLPSVFIEASTSGVLTTQAVTIARDGFRILLAKFAGTYINSLRKNESFMAVLEEFPAFSADVLLFTGTGSKLNTDGEGNLKV
ncbi:hypothetical protein H072_8133 [Dactylellina haptotyla CBS 200.50]|uniref:BTB domain-containing protein n=1 Tax=Dactylellina haptotyla (strain CBS 200.50) TaxID=1284197 RepID=S8BS92_DACHA|nr:hypothetical protein H072_8133 [Dactylellina haptotyla CBS 200.50]